MFLIQGANISEWYIQKPSKKSKPKCETKMCIYIVDVNEDAKGKEVIYNLYIRKASLQGMVGVSIYQTHVVSVAVGKEIIYRVWVKKSHQVNLRYIWELFKCHMAKILSFHIGVGHNFHIDSDTPASHLKGFQFANGVFTNLFFVPRKGIRVVFQFLAKGKVFIFGETKLHIRGKVGSIFEKFQVA